MLRIDDSINRVHLNVYVHHENSLVSVYFFHSEKTHHCIFVLIKSPIYPPFQTFPLTLRRCICFHAAYSTLNTNERAGEQACFHSNAKSFLSISSWASHGQKLQHRCLWLVYMLTTESLSQQLNSVCCNERQPLILCACYVLNCNCDSS